MKQRVLWIDWIKIIGIYLIVLGHMSAPGNDFIYVFHVPLFFITSGYLAQKADSMKVCVSKMYMRLIIPSIVWLIPALAKVSAVDILKNGKSVCDVLIHHWGEAIIGNAIELSVFWFIYTLVLVKILFQLIEGSMIRNKWLIHVVFCIFFFSIAAYLNYSKLFFQNSKLNIITAYPFFMIGYGLERWKVTFNELGPIAAVVMLLVGFVLTFAVLLYNGPVHLYTSLCGKYVTICIVGGISGTVMVYGLSKLIQLKRQWVTDLSNGTIVIMGLHPLVIMVLRIIYPIVDFSYGYYFISLGIMLLSYGIIVFSKKYCPILIGVK